MNTLILRAFLARAAKMLFTRKMAMAAFRFGVSKTSTKIDDHLLDVVDAVNEGDIDKLERCSKAFYLEVEKVLKTKKG